MPTPPPSQKDRPIGFALFGGGQSYVQNLLIRPEELTKSEPSRLNVQQTLGGAWADDFGRGVATIRISGHLGWRGSEALAGEDAFRALRNGAFVAWHQGRANQRAAGADPDAVQLFFVDTLDGFTDLVAPKVFTLRRSKTSPLLMRYTMELLVLDTADIAVTVTDPIAAAMTNPAGFLTGATELAAQAGAILGGLAALA